MISGGEAMDLAHPFGNRRNPSARYNRVWKLDSAGAGPGLQNRSAALCVTGGFDSH